MTQAARAEAVSFTPEVQVADPLAAWWLRQATLRLRREICWRWHQQEGESPGDVTRLPSPIDPLSESLDLARYADGKQRFFASDVTARYLSQQLRTPRPLVTTPQRGSFAWLVEVLELDEPACFLLALALLPVLDNAVGPVIATSRPSGKRCGRRGDIRVLPTPSYNRRGQGSAKRSGSRSTFETRRGAAEEGRKGGRREEFAVSSRPSRLPQQPPSCSVISSTNSTFSWLPTSILPQRSSPFSSVIGKKRVVGCRRMLASE